MVAPGSPDTSNFDSWRCLETGASIGRNLCVEEGQAFLLESTLLAIETGRKLDNRNREAAKRLELKANAALALLKDPSKTLQESQARTVAGVCIQALAAAVVAAVARRVSTCFELNKFWYISQAAIKAAAVEAMNESINQLETSVKQGRIAAETAAQARRVSSLFTVNSRHLANSLNIL